MDQFLGTCSPQQTYLASAARTATQTGSDMINTNAKGILVYVNVTAVPSVETLIVKVQAKDSLSSSYIDLAANTAQAATGMIRLAVYPTLAAVAAAVTGHTANNFLPDTWRITITHSASGSFTYSAAYTLLY